MIATSAWYVFGVVDAQADLAGDEVQLVREGGLAAVTTTVPLEEFGESQLEERLNDPVWLEEHARRHEEVLQRVLSSTAVVPFRFGAVYLDPDGVRELLRDRGTELRAALDRVRGCVELGVKLWADPAEVEAHVAPDAGAPASGRAYLERRQEQQDAGRRLAAVAAGIAADVYERLLVHALAGVVNRPQPRELTGRSETMILNGAYLVTGDGSALLAEASKLVAELAEQGVTVEVTGPWPPHNFVGEEAVA